MQASASRSNCDFPGCIGIPRLRVPFFVGHSRDGAVRSVGRGNRSILGGRQKWARPTGANVSEARWDSNELRATREARGGRSRESVLSSVVRSSTANAAEQCWHGKSAQRSRNERETETDREPTTRKRCRGNPSRGNIWVTEPERVAGVAGDSYYRASSTGPARAPGSLRLCLCCTCGAVLRGTALCRAVSEERGRRSVGLGN